MRLQGRTAIITGAGSGIGRASAKLFAEEGARLALVDRDAAGLEETLSLVRAATTHVGGTWLWARAAVPHMQRQNSGSIITLASHLAIAGGKGTSAYIAAKGAIVSLTRTMAVNFATDGIRGNAIAPGAIDTPMLRRSFARHANSDEVRDKSRNRHAMKRFGQAEELAQTALHLASDASSFTTGTVAVVDGGWLAA